MAPKLATERQVLAFDLPGHGGSLSVRAGGAGSMAKAVGQVLQERGIPRFHLVGHSMGGAVGALLGLRQPESVASLTLLAPGGFAPAINGALLRHYAAADDHETMAVVLRVMCGPGHSVDRCGVAALLEARAPAEARAALAAILDVILVDAAGRTQGVLPVDALGALALPITVLWGDADPILPVAQADGLPANVQARKLSETGHMLVEERPRDVLSPICETIARAG
nr:alpha/beta fold hydrolase [Pseudorhizobium flavum]